MLTRRKNARVDLAHELVESVGPQREPHGKDGGRGIGAFTAVWMSSVSAGWWNGRGEVSFTSPQPLSTTTTYLFCVQDIHHGHRQRCR